MINVNILREGDLQFNDDESIYAPTTITLITYESSITGNNTYLLVDAGGLEDDVRTLNDMLYPYDINHEDINEVILTHNHPDHTGLVRYLGGKEGATIYGPDSTYHNRNVFYLERCPEGIFDKGRFGNDISLLDTPGHESSLDRSVIVNDIDVGILAIVGDSILNSTEYFDTDNMELWSPDNNVSLAMSRKKIKYSIPDLNKIIPGHGPAFNPRTVASCIP